MIAIRSLEGLPEVVRRDREFGPAIYLLGSPLLADKISRSPSTCGVEALNTIGSARTS